MGSGIDFQILGHFFKPLLIHIRAVSHQDQVMRNVLEHLFECLHQGSDPLVFGQAAHKSYKTGIWRASKRLSQMFSGRVPGGQCVRG